MHLNPKVDIRLIRVKFGPHQLTQEVLINGPAQQELGPAAAD